MNSIAKFIIGVLVFACVVAMCYALVMYGPDKSISSGIQKNTMDIVEMRGHVSAMMLKLAETQEKNETIQHKYDSLINVQELYAKVMFRKLDSLEKARDPHYIKRIPIEKLK